MLIFFYPPFQGLASVTHLCESDKAVEVGRLSSELGTLHRGKALHGECRALTGKVNEFFTLLSAESAKVF